jgi:UDP-hydrolysing UDP-N-acetyl-D-glucosamine 2-epimerase
MKIAIVTGSRADRGALEMVEKALALAKPWHNQTFIIDLSDMPPAPRNFEVAIRTTESAERIRLGLGDGYADLMIIHGDRHEVLGAAMAANTMSVPIAHLGGGDITEGSQDDCFRHAITKLSHLHFATNQDSAARIIQMGEDPDRVHVTGDPGVDRILAMPLLDRHATFAAVGLSTPQKCLLVSFHPNTLGDDVRPELTALREALMRMGEMPMVLIGPNADAGSDVIRAEWRLMAANLSQVVYHENLPGQVYLSLMKHCDAMVGNSSAGLYEAPSFGLPVVNIGDRQKGRRKAGNIHDVEPKSDWILGGIRSALRDWGPAARLSSTNPYGDGHAAERIAKIIGDIKDPKALLRKRFKSYGAQRELEQAGLVLPSDPY